MSIVNGAEPGSPEKCGASHSMNKQESSPGDNLQPAPPANGPGTARTAMPPSPVVPQAKAAYRQGNWADAERLCRDVLTSSPHATEALNLLGIITAQTHRPQEAVELLSQAITINPDDAVAHGNLGNVLLGLGRAEQALAHFDRVIAIQPGDVDVLYLRSSILGGLSRYEEALQSCDRALAVKPDFVEALNNRGNALGKLNRHLEALESFNRALSIRPDYAEALSNRGAVLRELKRYDDALASYQQAIKIAPEFVEAIYNLGIVLSELGRPHEAVKAYERALTLKPDHVEANWNLALCRLQLGDYLHGWEGYEWRWYEQQQKEGKRNFPQPLWLGSESLAGKTILLHGEAGLGDTLQFCRYTKLVAALGARVVLEVQESLVELLSGLDGVTQALPRGASLPPFDYHCPLLSLPLAFKTVIDTIPAHIPYVYCAPGRVKVWREKLGAKTKPRVGLVWSGNPRQLNDQNRSLPLAELLPLLSSEFEWVSLQPEVRDGDAVFLARRSDIRHFGADLKDFADTAALLELMDVVVTVCTSVAHLAGAMGKPVYIMLCFNADWRWLMNRDDSPWYPTARLFRQPAAGDWPAVISSIRNAMSEQLQ